MRANEGEQLIFMQDSAPAHSAKGTLEYLRERGIICIQWPSYSPDSSPIETVWNWMKDWIQEHHNNNLRTYDGLRAAILAAWEAVDAAYLLELLQSMPARCQAVIDANGMHTRYYP
jgi:transposase